MIRIEPTNLKFGLLFPRSATRRIIIHHSASPDISASTIHNWHLQKGWSGIAYHYVIRLAGWIEAGRPVGVVGAHAGPEVNGDSIGICLTGNFMDYPPPAEQLLALAQLVEYLRNTYQTNLEVWRHKDVAATECPGALFPWPEKNWPLFALPQGEKEAGNTVEPWKNGLVTEAWDKNLISEEHNPDDPAPKWFVLAVGLNILEEVNAMAKSSKMNIQQFKEWIEKQGASCRLEKGRLECVIDIDHIEPGHFAALYAIPAPSGLLVVEVSETFPSEATAWQALQDDSSPAHPAQVCTEWMKEQYLTDKGARVERLKI